MFLTPNNNHDHSKSGDNVLLITDKEEALLCYRRMVQLEQVFILFANFIFFFVPIFFHEFVIFLVCVVQYSLLFDFTPLLM